MEELDLTGTNTDKQTVLILTNAGSVRLTAEEAISLAGDLLTMVLEADDWFAAHASPDILLTRDQAWRVEWAKGHVRKAFDGKAPTSADTEASGSSPA